MKLTSPWHHRIPPEAQPEDTAPAGPSGLEARVVPLTMATAIRPGGQLWLRGFFDAARRLATISEPLRHLGLIRAAHWTILTDLPTGKGHEREPLRPPYLLFESNFDLELGDYIEAFARVLPWRMRAVWCSGYGYPGVLPNDAFTRWTEDHRFPEAHYWAAYPHATTRTVTSALRVAERLRVFDAGLVTLDDDDDGAKEFAFRLRALLVELQGDL